MRNKTITENPAEKKKSVQKRSLVTKQKILDAAMDLFSEYGFEDTSIVMITQKADVALGSFYSYFENKWEIFVITLENHLKKTGTDAAELFNSVKGKNLKLQEKLDYLIYEMYEKSRGNLRLFFERQQLLLTNERLRTVYYEEERKGLELIMNFLDDHKDSVKEHDREYFAYIILPMIYITYESIYADVHRDKERILKELSRSVKAMIIKGC